MSSYKDIVYMVLDEIKSISGDQTITEEHVLFLMKKYRAYIIEQKIRQYGEESISNTTKQTLCLDLEKTGGVSALNYCNDVFLKTTREIPSIIDGTSITVKTPDRFAVNIKVVSPQRFRYVGHNKYMRGIIYATLNDDNYLYMRGIGPQFTYLENAKVTGIFEDGEEAEQLSCELLGHSCDIMERTFPLQEDAIPPLIESIVKELYQALIRPEDKDNNDNDDIADIARFIRSNVKSDLAKQIDS